MSSPASPTGAPPPIDCLGVVGVGLIGGSFALSLRRAGVVRRVLGFGRTASTLHRAVELGVIDEAAGSLAGLARCDLVLLATPVGQLPGVMQALSRHLSPRALVTDGGSTKRDVIDCARASLGAALPRFVPAHPIAGAEKSGPDAARAGLFEGRPVVLTPIRETAADAEDRVHALWQATGARVMRMEAEAHDRALAATSHLPHVLAFAMMNALAERPEAEAMLELTGGGFRDFTRIAASSPEMWRDICVSNRDLLCAEIDGYAARLAVLREAIARGDGAALEREFSQAREAREALGRRLANEAAR